MNCKELQETLVDYLEGKCGDRARSIANHIEECEACRREYNGLRYTIKVIKEISLEDPGQEFWEGQRGRIRDGWVEVESERNGVLRNLGLRLHRFRVPLIPLACFPACGAMVLLLIAGMFYFSGEKTPHYYPSGGAHLSFDEGAIGEAYLRGVLFDDLSAAEELDFLTDRDLEEVFQSLATDAAVLPGVKEKDIFPYDERAYGIECEIDNLDVDEIRELLDLLEKGSVRS